VIKADDIKSKPGNNDGEFIIRIPAKAVVKWVTTEGSGHTHITVVIQK
jgi:hypothetical protein